MRRAASFFANKIQQKRSYATVKVKINGRELECEDNFTILEAFRAGKRQQKWKTPMIPTLCHHPSLMKKDKIEVHAATCRVCLVEVDGKKLMPACVTKVWDGMEVDTQTDKVVESVRSVLKFVISRHELDCPSCDANRNCELQDLLERYHVSKKDVPKIVPLHNEGDLKRLMHDDELKHFEQWANTQSLSSTYAIKIDMDKCIRCGRCVKMCETVQDMGLLSLVGRGQMAHINLGTPVADSTNKTYDQLVLEEQCIGCGQCSHACPVGAITARNYLKEVQDLLTNPKGKVVVCQIAPSVRIGISEEFGFPPGRYSIKQLVAGLKQVGFQYVFDSLFTADLTIIEEGHELLERIKNGGPFPMFTSCCPGWINLVEKHYPEYIPNLSSCRSPQGMMSSLLKHYWAKKMGIKREDLIIVGMMPCTAKKDEAHRAQLHDETGYVLTTRELGQLFHMMGVHQLPDEGVEPDTLLSEGSGAADLFGVTGGVMEAALRTVYEVQTGKSLPKIEFDSVRGVTDGIKRADVPLEGLTAKIAVTHGTKNARYLLEQIKSGKESYHFVEVMACTGGCIGGGGAPKWHPDAGFTPAEVLQQRMNAIYSIDERKVLRKSHDNPDIKKLYKEFLGQPLSHTAHELLHTHYHSHKKE